MQKLSKFLGGVVRSITMAAMVYLGSAIFALVPEIANLRTESGRLRDDAKSMVDSLPDKGREAGGRFADANNPIKNAGAAIQKAGSDVSREQHKITDQAKTDVNNGLSALGLGGIKF